MLAIYCRTSKNKERDYSIESQQQGGLVLAPKLGIPHKYYVDEGYSGTLDIELRPAFAEMMSDIKRGKIQAVYCIDQSRIERNTSTWRFFVGECIINKCKYYPNGNEFDLTDPENMLFANLISLMNSFYAEITSKKVKIANYNKAKKGKTHGLKAYGYKRDGNNDYVIYEDEAMHVRRMFELSLQGIGTYSIANIFNEECVPTKFNSFKGQITRQDSYTKRETYFDKSKVKWRGNVIYDMLCNEIYKGIRVWKDLRVTVPAIISEELWQQVNDNLSKNKKNVGKKAKYHYLLNGLIYCSHCEAEVIGKKRLKGNDNAYKCKGKRPPHINCTHSRGISLPKFETFIIRHLFHSRELKQLLIAAPKSGDELAQQRKNLVEKEKERLKFKKNIERLANVLKDPELTNDENFTLDYKDFKNKLKNSETEIEELKIKIIELENGDRNKRTKSLIESYTENISFDELKKLVHSIIDRIELSHRKAKKSGYFTIKIFYKHYGEYSVFATDWQAMIWQWLYHHRSEARNDEELQDDKELLMYMIKTSGKKVSDYGEVIENFNGYDTMSSMSYNLKLKKEDLLAFDGTTF